MMSIQPEFNYLVDCDSLKEADRTYDIEANNDECAALAERFDLVSLGNLKAPALIFRGTGDLVELQCELIADLVQECVVTGKPLKKRINTKFERSFSASAETYFGNEKEPEGEGGYGGLSQEDDTPEPPDPMVEGGFDLGEIVAEQLSLEIDPFPRSPDADFDGFSSSGDEDGREGRANPFAVLEQLKKKS